MEIKFISNIRRGNRIGTGFLYIPKDKGDLLSPRKRVKVNLLNRFYFFSKITKHNDRFGVYVPSTL